MRDLFFPPPIPELTPTFVHNMDDGVIDPRYLVSRKRFTPEEQRRKKTQWERDKRAKEKE